LGRSEKWLRNAERKGKIPRARRDLNGWRVYTQEDIEKLKELLIPCQSWTRLSREGYRKRQTDSYPVSMNYES